MTYDGTITWLGHVVTVEYLARLRAQGLNPWLTIVTGQPVPARSAKEDGR